MAMPESHRCFLHMYQTCWPHPHALPHPHPHPHAPPRQALGLSSRASTRDVKAAYHKIALMYHPDKVTAEPGSAEAEHAAVIFMKVHDARTLKLTSRSRSRSQSPNGFTLSPSPFLSPSPHPYHTHLPCLHEGAQGLRAHHERAQASICRARSATAATAVARSTPYERKLEGQQRWPHTQQQWSKQRS